MTQKSKNFFAALDDNDDDDDHDIKQQPIVKSVSRSNKTAATPASSNKANLDEPSRYVVFLAWSSSPLFAHEPFQRLSKYWSSLSILHVAW